jgi:hypothetical protein
MDCGYRYTPPIDALHGDRSTHTHGRTERPEGDDVSEAEEARAEEARAEYRRLAWLDGWRSTPRVVAAREAAIEAHERAGGGAMSDVVVVVVVALLAAACGESARPVVVAAPVVVTPAPVVEEPEPAAWRCVREGRCAVPRETDGGILR